MRLLALCGGLTLAAATLAAPAFAHDRYEEDYGRGPQVQVSVRLPQVLLSVLLGDRHYDSHRSYGRRYPERCERRSDDRRSGRYHEDRGRWGQYGGHD